MNDTSAHMERSGGTSRRRPTEASTGEGQTLTLELPPAVVAQLVADVVERVKAELAESSPWLTRQQAAVYLAVPVSRLEKDRTVPAHRWDGRVLYHRAELDSWLQSS
jgi:hypothetical protein